MFKGVDFFPHDTKLPVMELRRYCVTISWVAAMIALALIFTKGLNFGIDFKGGALFEIQSKSGPVDIASLRSKLGALDLGDVQIQGLDQPNRGAHPRRAAGGRREGPAGRRRTRCRRRWAENIEIRRAEVVGPAVSGELKQAGIIAVSLADRRHPALHLVPLRMAIRRRGDPGARPRHLHHHRRVLACWASSSG